MAQPSPGPAVVTLLLCTVSEQGYLLEDSFPGYQDAWFGLHLANRKYDWEIQRQDEKRCQCTSPCQFIRRKAGSRDECCFSRRDSSPATLLLVGQTDFPVGDGKLGLEFCGWHSQGLGLSRFLCWGCMVCLHSLRAAVANLDFPLESLRALKTATI